MAQMLAIYNTPKDPEAFDRHYFETHVPLAKRFPGSESTRSAEAHLDADEPPLAAP
jgi:uncharacterized protein (TIGR02118 family)